MLKLTIGKLNIRLDGVEAGRMPENTLLFRSDFQEADLEYTFRLGENPAVGAYPVVYRAKDIVVFGKPGGLEARLLYMPDSHICYAYYEEISDRKINVYINGAYREYLRIDTIFISLLALERHEARREAFILHCAYMDFGGKAILFSGPSGIGKSTHSGLWCAEYPDKARVLNGDKCLLTREDDGRIFANGWPVCGSSGICHNEKREVAGIVLLQQAMVNQFVEEKAIRNFKQVLAQTTVNYWNNRYTDGAMNFIEGLLQRTGCGTYACNISREAVFTLYNELRERRWIS